MKRTGLNLSVTAVCLLLVASSVAANDVFAPAADITFRISTDEKSYDVADLVQLHYRVTNISHAALYIPREWEATCPTVPHIWAWFEDRSGNHLVPGYAGSCFKQEQTIRERMSKEAVLLKPGEHFDGPLHLDPKLFRLVAGRYRVEASLTGWREEKFTTDERAELQKLGHSFVSGEVHDSLTVVLTGELPDHPVDHPL